VGGQVNDLYLWSALWMAWSTTATIGYGEITPTTHLGRVVCCFVSFVGVAFAACLTAAFANILAWTPDELAALFYFEREKARRALRHDAACLVTSTIRQSIVRARLRRAEGQPPSLEEEMELHRHAMHTRRFRRNKIISKVRPRARAPASSCAAEQGHGGGVAQADQETSEEVRAEELLERAAHMRDASEALQRLTLPSATWLASLPEPPATPHAAPAPAGQGLVSSQDGCVGGGRGGALKWLAPEATDGSGAPSGARQGGETAGAAEGGEAPRSREAALRGEAKAVLAVPRPLPSCPPLPGSPTGS
jgi:hypothetical protein